MIALRRLLRTGALTLVIFTVVSVVSASPTAASDPSAVVHPAAVEHHDSGHHVASLYDLLFPAINFSIYFFILVRYVIPAMREYLRRRRADIVQAESESSAALARAEEILAVSKARLTLLGSEADGIRKDLVAIATRQAERLVAQAEESGTRRLADATLIAEQERRRALADVRSDLATAAIVLAEHQLRAALTSDDQRTFVQQFLKDATAP